MYIWMNGRQPSQSPPDKEKKKIGFLNRKKNIPKGREKYFI
ncbi:hypothetical protein BACPLE_00303 [Phocaeicola plebeius DSM 17135]|uniref:Uncharacterized protein n=1 Tax=Phocaeicola plebeius (strain DSM 17135 / JCM 12973 / CCUG 54634 / M2) TaxID=484018 RepID=B5CUD3_PHOPM|nr:hypothetical protein BACPLE_00303 [Phocaeicola plebeius DSM 17135]